MTDILLTDAQAAERLGVHENTLRKLAAGGGIDKVRLGRRIVRYRETDVSHLIRTGFPAAGAGTASQPSSGSASPSGPCLPDGLAGTRPPRRNDDQQEADA